MDTNKIKKFATEARNILKAGIAARLTALGFDHKGQVPENNLKCATKPFNVLLACTHPLITELADDLSETPACGLEYPLTPQCDLRLYAVSYP